jgi:hypothetical protein
MPPCKFSDDIIEDIFIEHEEEFLEDIQAYIDDAVSNSEIVGRGDDAHTEIEFKYKVKLSKDILGCIKDKLMEKYNEAVE